MNYSEASYFDGFAFAHIAAREEAKRLERLDKATVDNRRAKRFQR